MCLVFPGLRFGHRVKPWADSGVWAHFAISGKINIGLYLIIISVRIYGNFNINLILAVILDKIWMILLCKPLILQTYIFDKNIFGLNYVVWTDSVVQMISAFIKQMFCLLNFPNDFLQTVKIARIKIFLKINGLQINIIRILSRITAKIKFMF